ncbi:MAG TPA: KEOPS complex kinase/ATPase Bud32 [Candidatus Thermoplasmatota archaeon]|nr:KEOPS complex kinase/ATPase Bud32 [Candidatus Thermoplasmatota archaeon]
MSEAKRRGAVRLRGAEANLEDAEWMGRQAVAKRRVAKGYRHPALDLRLRTDRTRDEAALLAAARQAGVPVPVVYDVDREGATLVLERVPGPTLRQALEADGDAVALRRLATLGGLVARLHAAGITHGDLTTSNVLVPDPADADRLVLLDFGLGAASGDAEAQGVDLHLVEEALEATDARAARLFGAFLDDYRATFPGHAEATRRLEEIRERGRYR